MFNLAIFDAIIELEKNHGVIVYSTPSPFKLSKEYQYSFIFKDNFCCVLYLINGIANIKPYERTYNDGIQIPQSTTQAEENVI